MRFLCFFLLVALLAACSPSPAQLAVQTASAETVIAASWTKTPTSTLTPTVTSTSTSTPTSTPAPTITATPTPMGLGVTRTDIQSVYEKLGLTFDPPKTENGIPYTVGGYIESASGNQIAVIVVINGHSANLREVSVTVLLPPNLLTEPETGAKQHARALSYIQPLLDTIIPAWNQRSEWLDTAFRSFGNSSESKTSKQTTYRNFDILLEAEILREMGAVSIVLSIQVIK